MLSTLSINANGEVVGGSAKFKSSSNHLFADDASSINNEQQQDQKKTAESAKGSLSTAQIDMLKGDLQDLEASIDNDNRSLLDHRGGLTTPCDGQACEGAPTTTNGGAATQPSQPIPIRSGASSSTTSKKMTKKQKKQQHKKRKVLKGVLAQAKDKADDGVNPKWRVRLMTEADVDEVIRIQRLCYEPEYRELPESYVGRIRLYPQGNVIVEVPVSPAAADDTSSDSEGDSSDSDNDNDNDNDVSNDCDHDDDDDSEDNDNDHVAPVKQVKNQVTRYSPSGSPSCEDDARDLHSVKKRRVGKPTVSAAATKWRMAGYIQAQPYLREGINDVNDLVDLERWLADHPNMDEDELDPQRDVIYVHEIAMDPAFRGQGLTTPLTDYVQQLTADEGFAMITLVSLGPALGFWKRNGFIMCRELDYGGHICYYMEKPLVAAGQQPLADR